MNERLSEFMRAESLTAAKLAEILQVQPSSISHLLSGRNKPNFDFIARMLRMFEELSPDWIINGYGAMYRADMAAGQHIAQSDDNSNNKTTLGDDITDNKTIAKDTYVTSENTDNLNNEAKTLPVSDTGRSPIEINQNIASIENVMIIYSDNTFSMLNKK